MAGETSVNQLKEQLETSQTENRAIQKQFEERMDKFQMQMDSLSHRFDEQMAWLRHHFPENPEPGVIPVTRDSRDKGIPATMVPGIKPDLEHKETDTETDLKHKGTTHSDVSIQPNSKISKVRSISSMPIVEDSGECMIEKIDDNHGNSIGIFLPKTDFANNTDLGVLNPLGHGSVLVQRLLYSKCSNYNAKEPLDSVNSKLAEHGTITIEVNDSMMNLESGVTSAVYIIKVLQGRAEFGFVCGPNGILVINNTSPSSYKKMQLILNIRIFFLVMFDPGGVVS
ncbi:hypothetical protein LguiA_022662 [Lonicera macranthoides]